MSTPCRRNFHSKVKDLVTRTWDWNLVTSILPNAVVSKICAELPHKVILARKVSTNSNFTTKSAYTMTSNYDGPKDHVWKLIWKIQAPERVKMFVWLATQNKLPTRERYSKWQKSFANCELYNHKFYNHPAENTLHILRDCNYATRIWKRLINPAKATIFYLSALKDCILLESDSKTMIDGLSGSGVRKAETASLSDALLLELQTNCTFQTAHVWREATVSVDWLANHSQGLGMNMEIFRSPPQGILSLLVEDYSGIFRPRYVNSRFFFWAFAPFYNNNKNPLIFILVILFLIQIYH